MKISVLLAALTLTLVMGLSMSLRFAQEEEQKPPRKPDTEICSWVSERDGRFGNKICFYDCPSGEVAITVKDSQVCPSTIRHER